MESEVASETDQVSVTGVPWGALAGVAEKEEMTGAGALVPPQAARRPATTAASAVLRAVRTRGKGAPVGRDGSGFTVRIISRDRTIRRPIRHSPWVISTAGVHRAFRASPARTLPDALQQLEDDLRARNRDTIREAFRVL
jgi:hypothetical protein